MSNQETMNFGLDDDSVESIDFMPDRNGLKTLAEELDEASNDFMDVSEICATSSAVFSKPKLQKGRSIRVSGLSESIREKASQLHLDRNDDGDITVGDIAMAIDDLQKKRRSNKMLTRIILGFLVLTIAMVGCIFAASLTAARLSKDFSVSSDSGLALVKGSAEPVVMKTHSAIFYNDKVSIGGLPNNDLGNLREIVLKGGDLKVIVKGYSRDPFDEERKVIILVEGGTMTYDDAGIVAATGNAKMALEALYGTDIFEEDGRTRRLTGLTDSTECGFVSNGTE